MRISPGYAFTFPLGALIFGAMMVNSAYRVLSGRGVTWKGRRYLAKGRRAVTLEVIPTRRKHDSHWVDGSNPGCA
jgi:hypothetical protein